MDNFEGDPIDNIDRKEGSSLLLAMGYDLLSCRVKHSSPDKRHRQSPQHKDMSSHKRSYNILCEREGGGRILIISPF